MSKSPNSKPFAAAVGADAQHKTTSVMENESGTQRNHRKTMPAAAGRNRGLDSTIDKAKSTSPFKHTQKYTSTYTQEEAPGLSSFDTKPKVLGNSFRESPKKREQLVALKASENQNMSYQGKKLKSSSTMSGSRGDLSGQRNTRKERMQRVDHKQSMLQIDEEPILTPIE